MKTMKKLLSTLLIAAFFLTTAAQTDAFAFSIKKTLKKAASVIAKPVAKLVSLKTNPIINKIQGIIQNKIIKPIIKPLVYGIKETINLGILAVTDWQAFRQQLRMWGGKLGIYNYSDHDFIRHVSDNEKIRQALLLLREKTPDVFKWIKSNLAMIEIGNTAYIKIARAARRDPDGVYNVSTRTVTLDQDSVNSESVAEVAELIAHEVFHLVDYFNGGLNLLSGRWKNEYAADQFSASVADRLGIGAGWRKLDKSENKQINGLNITVTDELKSWNPGSVSTGGYWNLATTALKGTTTSASRATYYTSTNPNYIAQATRSYTTDQVEIDYSGDADNPKIKVIGSSIATSTFLLSKDGVLRRVDTIKGGAESKEKVVSENVLNKFNATVDSASIVENDFGDMVVRAEATDAAGYKCIVTIIAYKNGGSFISTSPRSRETGLGNVANPSDQPAASSDTGAGRIPTSTTQTRYDKLRNRTTITTTKIDANGNISTSTTYVKGHVTAYTANVNSSITYPPVGGPQGGIAPDVVNPNVVQINAAVNVGGK